MVFSKNLKKLGHHSDQLSVYKTKFIFHTKNQSPPRVFEVEIPSFAHKDIRKKENFTRNGFLISPLDHGFFKKPKKTWSS